MTKLTTDQIKRLCEVTPGWEYSARYIEYPGGLALTRKCLNGEHDLWNTLLLPLLIYQACDEKRILILPVEKDKWDYIIPDVESKGLHYYSTPNEARIAALEECLK